MEGVGEVGRPKAPKGGSTSPLFDEVNIVDGGSGR